MAVVKGLDTILGNLNKEISKIEGNVQKGLTLGAQIIKADSMTQTPVDTGNLRGSHYVVSGDGKVDAGSVKFDTKDKGGQKVAAEHAGHLAESKSNAVSKRKPFVEIGLTAYYAEAVHENLEAHHPTGKAKFLEDAIRKGSKNFVTTIKRFATV